MTTGLWLPISSNAISFGLIIAILWMVIYAFYYNVRRGSINKLENSFNNLKGKDVSDINSILHGLNVPDSTGIFFKNRNIDFSNNTVTYFTDGLFSFALGSHKGLRVPKVLFRMNCSNNPVIHKLHVIDDHNKSIAELYLTAESMIFSEPGIRYYEASWLDLRKLSEIEIIQLDSHDSKVKLSKDENNQILDAVQFVLNLKSNDQHSLLARNE